MKPLNRKNYGSIPHLSNSRLGEGDHHIEMGQERILTVKKRDKHDEIFAFEKYDGSNVGICKVDGKIHGITRPGYLSSTSKYDLHHDFNEWVLENERIFDRLLNEGERVVGDWLKTPHTIVYKSEDPIVFFDGFDNKNRRMSVRNFADLIGKMGLCSARWLHNGDAIPVADLIDKLNEGTVGFSYDQKPEGIVYRVERKGKVDFLAKWVREDFESGKYLNN